MTSGTKIENFKLVNNFHFIDVLVLTAFLFAELSVHEKIDRSYYVNNEGTDQPARLYNLTSAFVTRSRALESRIFTFATCIISIFSLASIAEQVRLSMTW